MAKINRYVHELKGIIHYGKIVKYLAQLIILKNHFKLYNLSKFYHLEQIR